MTTGCANAGREPRSRRWVRVVGVNLAAALMVATLLTPLGSRNPFPVNLLIALAYAYAIGPLAAVVMPRLGRRIARAHAAVRWTVLTAALLGLAGVGSVVASAFVIVVGALPAVAFRELLFTGFRASIVVTLGLGAGMILYGSTRARLEAVTQALRAEEVARERAERLAAEARLGVLAARLQPHFLFNALNAIAALIPENPTRAERLVEQLSKLLREALDTGARRTVPLADELRLVTAYLDIEEARFGSRLRAAIDIPAEMRGYAVPPLALQTLVENSVKHVAARRREGAQLVVEARVDDGRLFVNVRDDGPGFTAADITPGHGLDTLRERLVALFGRDGTLEIVRQNGGMCVTMSLPASRASAAEP